MLEEKIKNKLMSAEENRLEKLNSITERLKEHVNIYVYDFRSRISLFLLKFIFTVFAMTRTRKDFIAFK